MYIDRIALKDFRTFRKTELRFTHPDVHLAELGLPLPKLRNINLLLGNNGYGKTTILKAIALACLGPLLDKSGIYAYHFVRREPKKLAIKAALIDATLTLHQQDARGYGEGLKAETSFSIHRRGDFEDMGWTGPSAELWEPIFQSRSDAFFFVGYGASRRSEQKNRYDKGMRRERLFGRTQRIQSLFEEGYSLVPLSAWLPTVRNNRPGLFRQVVALINKLLGPGHYQFKGETLDGECVFEKNGLKIPLPALSDGYRAYLGWISDLLYHLTQSSRNTPLDELSGVVLIDEIDLHLHPKWQMEVLPTLAKVFSRIQFIVTSHSPLVVGSLEWSNILAIQQGRTGLSKAVRIDDPVHGLDADQVLLTDFFGLESTRARGSTRRLKQLSLDASKGSIEAAAEMLKVMSEGTETSNDRIPNSISGIKKTNRG